MAEFETDRNVYILGAGFSSGANAPLLNNFLDKARELLDNPNSGLDAVERSEFQTVFDFRMKMAQAREKVKIDLDNIEQLFGLVEMQQRLSGNALSARNATVYLIAKTLELTIDKPRTNDIWFTENVNLPDSKTIIGGLELPVQPNVTPAYFTLGQYDFFARLIGGQFDAPEKRRYRKDTVLTFNYDLVLDSAFQRAGILTSYHLPPQFLSTPAASNSDNLTLLKLHGSTNWGICGTCKRNISVFFSKVTSSPSDFRRMACPKCDQHGFQPMLVPPSWDKSEYQELMRPVWSQAIAEIKRATRICIIGYSLPESDAYFKYLLTLGLAENHRLYKLIVVDARPELFMFPSEINKNAPKTKTLRERYDDLLEGLFQERRFKFFNDGFSSWLRHATSDLGRGELITLR
jgi:hypothetical protein